jgi:hypothetical protein
VAHVLAKRPRPTLRTLTLGQTYSPLGDVSAMWPALAYLREVNLAGTSATLGDVRAPALEHFRFEFGPVEDGVQDLDFLASLWSGNGVPNLRVLALASCDRTDALCEALVAAPLANQLVEIDLSDGTMSDAGAAVLCAHRDRFPHVQRWRFDHNYLTASACSELATLGSEVTFDEQRVADGDRHASAYE